MTPAHQANVTTIPVRDGARRNVNTGNDLIQDRISPPSPERDPEGEDSRDEYASVMPRSTLRGTQAVVPAFD